MVVLGIDAHKRSHTVVVVDDVGRKLGERTLGTTTADHLTLLTWAEKFGSERLWAVEDCRHLRVDSNATFSMLLNASSGCRRR